MTISTPELPRRRRARFSLSQAATLPDCSGRSWWSGSRSPSSPGSGRTPCTIYRCAASRPALRSSAARPACRSPTAWLAYSPKNTYLRAFIVGIVNTLRVAVIGIVLATVLGTLVGIARLSSNWLLSRLAAVYVEVLRDMPLLLQLLFWYVLMQGLPAARAAWKPIEGVFLSNRGLVLPSIPIEEANLWVLGAAAAGLIALYLLRRRLIARQMQDGQVAPALALRAGRSWSGCRRWCRWPSARPGPSRCRSCAASISSAG